jgi:3D (Asp-Asp-Asp) domain-containing protein
MSGQIGLGLALCGVTAGSAVLVKQAGVRPMVAVDVVGIGYSQASEPETPRLDKTLASPETPGYQTNDESAKADDAPAAEPATDAAIRWFNGRPIRPGRTMWMTVTGYSPDAKSCGDSADGITASMHSVSTNNMNLVAADTRLLPFGSMISVPGYDDAKIVPVLDRGGAIKGHHIDLLFPTDAQARQWGVKRLQVVVWEYADGKPADNPRELR